MTVRVRVEFVRLGVEASSGSADNCIGSLHGNAMVLEVGGTALSGANLITAPQFSARNHTGYARVTAINGMVLASWGDDSALIPATVANSLLLVPNVPEVIPMTKGQKLSLVEFV